MGQLNPTRQEILEAHEALEKLCQRLPATRAAKETILRALPPLPRLTMAEIEWDEEEHFLAEAEHPNWGKVVMLYEFDEFISFMQTSDGPKVALGDVKERFTPTGRRYVLQGKE